ncbi:TetR/AcrR family transcriptional regulator [Planctomonas sp. JC2975]|uniref:TetR family transcriptional regulator n=1 Tax=Planctomonas sp. JC2975 TaxID=2729626 RepID=UPI0014738FBA|nr:TetR/AcrR family transcriptional regulator [Planctomonas sp. JC2975]
MKAATTRPRDAERTRERILASARREFARVGFGRATVRGIAASAGVSPNLVTRYFGGKDGLFVAAAEVRLRLDDVFDGDRASLGRRLAESMVARWTTMEGDDPLLVLLRASGEREEAARTLSEFLDAESLEPFRQQLLSYGMTEDDATARAKAVDAFALGISARYRVLRNALGDADAVTDWIAVTAQRLVDAP